MEIIIMTDEWTKPKVVISKCIEYDYCRWNSNIIKSPIVDLLKKYVEFQPVCAEYEIGLGVPRDPVRIVIENDEKRLIQPSTGRDVTDIMINFTRDFIDSLDVVDGFILKSQSPSCGTQQTKYLAGREKGAATLERGAGFFGGEILNVFPDHPIETEGRLRNFRIREFFLTKLYTLARFREVKNSHSKHELVNFHTKNKFLFLAYNQNEKNNLGKIVANPQKHRFEEIIKDYEHHLALLLNKPPKYTSNINVLMHALGYFSKYLNKEEKAYFLDELEKYRAGWVPIFSINILLKSWIVRFQQDYLKQQTYFDPFPEDLMIFDLKDTWRGRDYWRNM